MTNLVENGQWEPGIYQLETSDPVEGGPDGVDNVQARQLANRTAYLKGKVEGTQGSLDQHVAAADPHPQYATRTAMAAAIAQAVAALVNSSPASLDTLKELADAIGDDPNFSTTMLNALAGKATLAGSSGQQFAVGLAALPEQAPQLSQIGHGQCRLSVVTATQLKLLPCDGCNLVINQIPRKVPAAGVSIAPDGLAQSTLYYVYVYMNGTTMALEFSKVGRAMSIDNGVWIKTGDSTRTLVGMIYTSTTGQFYAGYVLNWFNRRNVEFHTSAATGASTSSGTAVELTTSARLAFLCWGDEGIYAGVDGEYFSSNGGSVGVIEYVDGVKAGPNAYTNTSAGSGYCFSSSSPLTLPEGFHIAMVYGLVTTGQMTIADAVHKVITRG